MERNSGIIMHITSLPGEYGIGTLGKEAYNFVNFLDRAGQKYWQILPLTQTGYGNSPYQSCSAFSGNPYLIDFDLLTEDGLLSKKDYAKVDFGKDKTSVDYGKIFENKLAVLKKAYKNSIGKLDREIQEFKNEQHHWIYDYALFMAIKTKFNNIPLKDWDDSIRRRDYNTLEYYRNELKDDIDFWTFLQYEFFKQWKNLKAYANSKKIEIIGDIPIYVAEDSVDVWTNPQDFFLDSDLHPSVVSGCPPDAFSKTGQLWGNPIYNWPHHRNTGFGWWKKRIMESLKLYDVIRIDHFRGFEAYWEIPAGEETAVNGRWVKGPGIDLFNAIRAQLGDIKIIAEDLGYITPSLLAFREATKIPGMKVLQFAFDTREESDYLPHNYPKDCVVYTGTHDNDTVMGWLEESGREEDVEFCKKYLRLTEEEGYNWGFIKGAWSSVANVSIALFQDFIGTGSESRMNIPSTMGWWKWRAEKKDITNALADKIYDITKTYGRLK